ncbi:hypothetical protein [Enterococcus pallens]|uniref:hypothetical protein n=1 Tax=Enterococcus pallens TaxID=160454 RepID=UPI00054F6004|nr:hypothetical protein [Enterococcus pallens]
MNEEKVQNRQPNEYTEDSWVKGGQKITPTDTRTEKTSTTADSTKKTYPITSNTKTYPIANSNKSVSTKYPTTGMITHSELLTLGISVVGIPPAKEGTDRH